jgi:hypothetical protein
MERPATQQRERILGLEERMRQALKDGTAEEPYCPVTHHFAPGAYGREIFMPKDALVVGKIHKHAHVNVISQGLCLVMTEAGTQLLAAPRTWVSQPGTKRVVYILEDTIWTTVHVTEETDLEKIEAHVIAPNYQALQQHQALLQTSAVQADEEEALP